MAISGGMVTAMRAYLGALHADSNDEFHEPVRKAGRGEGLDLLLLAAFTVAARRRFAPAWYPADVIRYIAEIRSSTSEMAGMLNAMVAENQLRAALGQQVSSVPDAETRMRAQMILLIALTADYSEKDLDTFMTDARAVAENWLA